MVLEKKLAHESTLNCNQENLNTALIVEVLPNGIKYEIPIKIEIKEIVQPASPIPAQTNLNYIFSQYDRNKVTSSGGSYRRSTMNYENDFISQHQNKRKIISLSTIMTSSRADLNTICNNNNTPKKPPQLNFNILTNNNKLETPKQQVKQLK